MNPYKLKNVFEYLTSNNQLLKKKLKLGTSEIPIPPKRQDVIDIEVINRFSKANPRVDTTNLQPLSVKHSNVKKPDEPDMKADGGRIGYKDGPKLTDFLNVQASGSKSGKQDMYSIDEKSAIKLPEYYTSDKETINAIIQADIPLTEKVNLIGNLKYGKSRDKIEYKDNEVFLKDSKSYKDRNIGLDYNRGGEGFSGYATVGDRGPEFRVQYKKSFADGGRIGLRGGGMDMGNASNQAQSASMGSSNSSTNQGPAGGASAGGNYGGNRNPSQTYGGSIFNGGNNNTGGGAPPTVLSSRNTGNKGSTINNTITKNIIENQKIIEYLNNLDAEEDEKDPALGGGLKGYREDLEFGAIYETPENFSNTDFFRFKGGVDLGDIVTDSFKSGNLEVNPEIGIEGSKGGVNYGATYDKDGQLKIRLFKEFAEGGRAGYEDGGMLVQPSNDGSRPGYKGSLTKKQQQKVIEAFPNDVFDFDTYPMFGAKKYLTNDHNVANPIHTKVDRFRKKGFTLEMGKGFNTRGVPYSKEGKRLSIKDQNKIKANYDLPEGVKEWDFSKAGQKFGFKPTTKKLQNIVARMTRTLAEKGKWTLAADFGNAKGWMTAQMQRVYKNETEPVIGPDGEPTGKRKVKKGVKLTYDPKYAEISGKDRIVGFKDNTVAGQGKTYYALDKYTKKGAGDWTQHGDWKLNNKLIDISKRAKKAPNEVIMGLLKDNNFKTKNLQLSHLIHFLSGTEATSKAVIANAVVRHHNSGVKFGSATNDLSLTTAIVNKRIVEAEKRIRANNILPEDVQLLKNNNVYVRGANDKLYGAGKKSPIGQFKQIESSVVNALETGVDFKGNKFKMADLKRYVAALGGGACSVFNGKKADGGRIGLATGTPNIDDCYKSGTAVINSGKVPIDKADDFAQVLKRAGSLGRNIMKIGIIPEALYATADSLIRVGMGDTFAEAGLRATDYLLPGDQTKIAEMSKVSRFFGDETGELVGRTIDYKNQLAKIQSLEDQKASFENLSDGGEFSYIGDLSGDVKNTENLLSQAKNDLDNKFKISEAEQLYAESKQDDAYDASAATSFLSNLKRKYGDSSGRELDNIETLAAPEKTQMQLNLDMLPQVDRGFMMATDDQLTNAINKESVRSGEKLNPQLYIDYRDKLKDDFMTKGPGVYGKEQVYGTQGIFGGEPVDMTNYKPSDRFGSGSQQRPVLYPKGRNPLGLASGGIANLMKKYND